MINIVRTPGIAYLLSATLLPVQLAYGTLAHVLDETSEQATFSLVTVVEDLDFAWDIEFLPNGDLLLSEYDGRLRLLPNGEAENQLILDAIPDVTEKGGLRGVSAHPDFERNGLLYFCHATGTVESNHTRITRGRLSSRKLVDIEVVFDADNASEGLLHYGCRLNWLPDGTLLATMGDRYHHLDKAQDLANHYGTAIRINDDGTVPRDNPFARTANVKPEIWAFGLRNIQGAAFHPQTGALWASEHGPRGGDEINVIRPGRNYGWPIATFGIDYDGTILTDTPMRPEVEPPLYYWYPSIAPSSVAFYTGDDFPKWQNDLFVTSLREKRLLRLELNGERIIRVENLLSGLDERLRDVTMGPDGKLYLLTDAANSRLMRIEHTASSKEDAK